MTPELPCMKQALYIVPLAVISFMYLVIVVTKSNKKNAGIDTSRRTFIIKNNFAYEDLYSCIN